jgi:hypothetical protein
MEAKRVSLIHGGSTHDQLAMLTPGSHLSCHLQPDASHGGFCTGGRRTLSSCSEVQMYRSLGSGSASLGPLVALSLMPNSMHEPTVSS